MGVCRWILYAMGLASMPLAALLGIVDVQQRDLINSLADQVDHIEASKAADAAISEDSQSEVLTQLAGLQDHVAQLQRRIVWMQEHGVVVRIERKR